MDGVLVATLPEGTSLMVGELRLQLVCDWLVWPRATRSKVNTAPMTRLRIFTGSKPVSKAVACVPLTAASHPAAMGIFSGTFSFPLLVPGLIRSSGFRRGVVVATRSVSPALQGGRFGAGTSPAETSRLRKHKGLPEVCFMCRNM